MAIAFMYELPAGKTKCHDVIRQFRLHMVTTALIVTNGNKSAAARLLGTARNNLSNWLKEAEEGK